MANGWWFAVRCLWRRLVGWPGARRTVAARMQAIAGALDGLTRAEATRLAGMERQALRDALVRYNAEGLAGLHDRPRPGSEPWLDETQRAALRQLALDGPDVEASGLSAWSLADLCREVVADALAALPNVYWFGCRPTALS